MFWSLCLLWGRQSTDDGARFSSARVVLRQLDGGGVNHYVEANCDGRGEERFAGIQRLGVDWGGNGVGGGSGERIVDNLLWLRTISPENPMRKNGCSALEK